MEPERLRKLLGIEMIAGLSAGILVLLAAIYFDNSKRPDDISKWVLFLSAVTSTFALCTAVYVLVTLNNYSLQTKTDPDDRNRRHQSFIRLSNISSGLLALTGVLLLFFIIVRTISNRENLPPVASATAATRAIVWTEFTRNGELIARAVVKPNLPCPQATVDGTVRSMEERVPPSLGAFSVHVCQIRYGGTGPVRIGDEILPGRLDRPRKILVLGDTGCRIGWYAEPQACADAALWPFRRIAEAAVRKEPDLIIHVGDYYYRESPCPARHTCGDSPFGDTWDTWSAEFFTPAAALLKAAPWIMLRGNHEDCAHAGVGWFYFLDPGNTVPLKGCSNLSDSYVLRFADLDMAVLDTAHAEDAYNRKDRLRDYIKQYKELRLDGSKAAWLLLHQPLWASYGCQDGQVLVEKETAPEAPGDDPNLNPKCKKPLGNIEAWYPLDNLRREVAPKDASSKVSLVLSGHAHLFQFFGPEKPPARPVQLVVGNGGQALDRYNIGDADANLYGVKGHVWTREEFGFVLLTRDDPDPGWEATLYDINGDVFLKCTLANHSCK